MNISNDRKFVVIRAGTFGYLIVSLLSVTPFPFPVNDFDKGMGT